VILILVLRITMDLNPAQRERGTGAIAASPILATAAPLDVTGRRDRAAFPDPTPGTRSDDEVRAKERAGRSWAWAVSAGVHALVLVGALSIGRSAREVVTTMRVVPAAPSSSPSVAGVRATPGPQPSRSAPAPAAAPRPRVPAPAPRSVPAAPASDLEPVVAQPQDRQAGPPDASATAHASADDAVLAGEPQATEGAGSGGASGGGGGVDAWAAAGLAGGLADATSTALPARLAARPPVVVSRFVPDYPRGARARGVEGVIVLAVVLDARGRLEDPVKVVRSVPELDAAAIAALRRWRFTPAYDADGRPLRVVLEVPFRFSQSG
jgi:protein TonB